MLRRLSSVPHLSRLFRAPAFHTSIMFRDAWKPHQDKLLLEQYEKYGPSWTFISFAINSRSPTECRKRILTLTNALDQFKLPHEKEWAFQLGYEKHGNNWIDIPQDIIDESPFQKISKKIIKKTLREKRTKKWTELEIMALREGYDQYGSDWEAIARRMPRR